MDVFKSFQMHFTTYETNNKVTSYETMKFEKVGKTKLSDIPHRYDNIDSSII